MTEVRVPEPNLLDGSLAEKNPDDYKCRNRYRGESLFVHGLLLI
jgi:hypothetical protein